MSLTYEVNGVIVCHPLNWYNCPAGGLRCTGGLYDASLT